MIHARYFYIVLITLAILIGYFTYLNLFVGLLFFCLLITILVIGVFNIRASVYVNSFCRVKTSEKIVFLTFDDGPCETTTPTILDTLKARDIKATFFCIGQNVEKNAAILQRINNEGHLVGSHTFSHQWQFTFSCKKEVRNEIEKGNGAIQNAIGIRTKLFRPPFGITNPIIANALQTLHLTSIGWSIRSYDTLHNDPEKLLNRIVSQLKPGAIILLHDRLPITARILPDLIEHVYQKGYKILPLQQFLNTRSYNE